MKLDLVIHFKLAYIYFAHLMSYIYQLIIYINYMKYIFFRYYFGCADHKFTHIHLHWNKWKVTWREIWKQRFGVIINSL